MIRAVFADAWRQLLLDSEPGLADWLDAFVENLEGYGLFHRATGEPKPAFGAFLNALEDLYGLPRVPPYRSRPVATE